MAGYRYRVRVTNRKAIYRRETSSNANPATRYHITELATYSIGLSAALRGSTWYHGFRENSVGADVRMNKSIAPSSWAVCGCARH